MFLLHDNQDCKFLEPSAKFTIGDKKALHIVISVGWEYTTWGGGNVIPNKK